jgi:nicotinamide-nucleotide amidase
MNAEIVAVGSELLTPDHLDTNSLFLTGRLNEAGFEVHLKTIVGDSAHEITEVVQAALTRSDVVVITGGLGPTEDDVTRQAVAEALGRRLSLDAGLLENLRRRFAGRGIPMPAINDRQAFTIEGAEVLPNPNGSAPGMWIAEGTRHIALMPGPPNELKPMYDAQVAPRVAALGGGRRVVRRALRIIGMTESEVDSITAPIYSTCSSVQTTILASAGYIGLYMYQWVRSGERPEQVDSLSQAIQATLGDAVFTTSDESLEEVLGRMLRESGNTLAVAESCTSGLIGMRLTGVPGSSDYFLGGVLCYSNKVKEHLCGVPAALIQQHGAVSPEVAEALAQGVRQAIGSSIGLSVTGIAGPGGGSADKPVGLVYLGLADAKTTTHARRVIPGDRQTVRERTAAFALALLRRRLLATE